MSQEELAKQDLGKAVKTRNFKEINACVTFLRFNFGYKYKQIFEIAKSHNANLTEADWDALLDEAEDG